MARLQSNTRIYGTANVDTSIAVGSNVIVNTSTLFIGNSTVNTFISTSGITVNNNVNINFRTVNAAATVGMRQQNDDNFVFYTTNTAYGQRAVFSIYANSATSALNISTDLQASANLLMNSGYGSATVAYGCRAWVSWVGSTGTIRASGGVTSVTRNASGDYSINFSFTFPDANYSATMMSSKPALSSGSSNILCIAENAVPTTTVLRVYNNPSNNGAAVADPTIVCVAVFR